MGGGAGVRVSKHGGGICGFLSFVIYSGGHRLDPKILLSASLVAAVPYLPSSELNLIYLNI